MKHLKETSIININYQKPIENNQERKLTNKNCHEPPRTTKNNQSRQKLQKK